MNRDERIRQLEAELAALVDLEAFARVMLRQEGQLPYRRTVREALAKLDALRAQPSPTSEGKDSAGAGLISAASASSDVAPVVESTGHLSCCDCRAPIHDGVRCLSCARKTAKLDGETGPKCGHLMRDGETVLGLCEREPDHDGSHAIVRLLNGPPEEAVRCHKCGKPAEVNDYEGGKGPPVCCDCCEPDAPFPTAEVEQATGEAKGDELCYAFGGEPGGPAFQCVALKGHDGPHYLMAQAPIPKSFRPAPLPPIPGGHGSTEALRGELIAALNTSGNEAMKWLARELSK